jgi:hypothetical protein
VPGAGGDACEFLPQRREGAKKTADKPAECREPPLPAGRERSSRAFTIITAAAGRPKPDSAGCV